jgi:hypothetical protein
VYSEKNYSKNENYKNNSDKMFDNGSEMSKETKLLNGILEMRLKNIDLCKCFQEDNVQDAHS